MRQGLWKKTVSVVLAAAMTASLAACGGGESASDDGTKRYFKATYPDDLPDTFTGNVSDVKFRGDVLYYSVYDDEYTKCSICSYNMTTGEAKTYCEVEMGGTTSSASIYYYTVSDDGEVYYYLSKSEIDTSKSEDYTGATEDDVISYMVDSWGYDEDGARSDWADYYESEYTADDGTVDYAAFLTAMNATWIYSGYLVKVDASGNEVYEQFIMNQNDGDTYYSCNGMEVDAEGNVCIAMDIWDSETDEYSLRLYGADGTQKGEIALDGYVDNLVRLSDGTIAYVCYGDSDYEMTPVDFDTLSLLTDETVEIPSSVLTFLDDENVLVTDGTSLYEYNLDTKEKELYLTWMDCNILSSSVNSYTVLSDGRLAVFVQNWYSSGNNTEIALIEEVDKSELEDVIYLTMATFYEDSGLEQQIIEFNKKQDKYHITMTSYYTGDLDYDDAQDAFMTAVTTDESIDLVKFDSYSNAESFAAKGLNADLYELIDADEELSRDDFLPNILTACEYDGKLAFLTETFTIQTVVGKTSDVGDAPGWTVSDMTALLASKPEGTKLFQSMTRSDMLRMCVEASYGSFIDMENTECYFDSQEFVDLLELAGTFPEEYEWNEDESASEMLNQGTLLLYQYYLGDFDEIQLYRAVYSEDITFIGYPNGSGSNGALLSISEPLAITTNCSDMDGAWEFMRTLFLADDTDDDDDYYYGFSVRADEFEKYCEEAQEEDEYGNTYGWDDYEVEIEPATQADVDTVKDLVYNTTAVVGALSDDVMNIITEEAEAYFSGQKTAEDVASIIQSRIKVYLSETK